MKSLCTVCDTVYFKEHAIKLINSVENSSTNLIVIILNPNIEDLNTLKNINRNSFNTKCNFITDFRNTKTFYASARYIYSQDIITQYELDGVMFLDADSLLIKDVEYPDTDFGLFLREPFPNTTGIQKEGSYVLGSSVYIGKSGISFAKYLKDELNSYNLDTWYQDQVALWKAYNLLKNNLSFTQLDKKYLDWDFSVDSVIWNAKGPRKYEDKRFVQLANEYSSTPFSYLNIT